VKVVGINEDNCYTVSPLECLEKAVQAIKDGRFEPSKIYLVSDDGCYRAGLANRFEGVGILQHQIVEDVVE
jgi:hypothetical protein